MKRNWPVWTLGALGAVVALDSLIILVTKGPLGCGAKDTTGSGLAAVFTLFAFASLIGGPSTLIFAGLRDARTRTVPAYLLIAVGVPVIVVLSAWAIGSAGAAASCGSSFLMMGG